MSTIFFNIFVTKNQDFKNKFIAALDCAVNTIENAVVFNEYTDKIVKVANNIMQCFSVVNGEPVTTQKSNKTDNNKHIPVNSSNEEMIITKRLSDINISINFIKVKFLYLSYRFTKYFSGIYNFKEITNNIVVTEVGILFFILFNIFIVRMKNTINDISKKEYVKNNINRLV